MVTLYTDLDSSLLGRGGSLFADHAGNPSSAVCRALFDAKLRGIDVIPVSGRTVAQLFELARLLGCDHFIAEMGAFLCDRLPALSVTKAFSAPLGDDGQAYLAISESGAVDYLLSQFPGKIEYHLPWSENRQCTHLLRGEIDLALANRRLQEGGFGDLRLVDNGAVRSSGTLKEVKQPHAYHLLPVTVSKGSAVALDRKRRDIPRDACVAIGDSASDLSMAEHVDRFFLLGYDPTSDPEMRERVSVAGNITTIAEPGPAGWASAVSQLL